MMPGAEDNHMTDASEKPTRMPNKKKRLAMSTSRRENSSEPVVDTSHLGNVILYHSTTRENVACILREGFRDRDYYMQDNIPGQLCAGVWLSDKLLGENQGAVSLELPDGVLVLYEWLENGKSYRQFLVPADIANRAERKHVKSTN